MDLYVYKLHCFAKLCSLFYWIVAFRDIARGFFLKWWSMAEKFMYSDSNSSRPWRDLVAICSKTVRHFIKGVRSVSTFLTEAFCRRFFTCGCCQFFKLLCFRFYRASNLLLGSEGRDEYNILRKYWFLENVSQHMVLETTEPLNHVDCACWSSISEMG